MIAALERIRNLGGESMPDKMFAQTFVEATGKTRKTSAVVFSFGGQIVVVIILILIPLIYTDSLPRAQLTSFLVAPPPPPPPPPPTKKKKKKRRG